MDLYSWNIMRRQSIGTPDDYSWDSPNRELYLYEPARDMAFLLLSRFASLHGDALIEWLAYSIVRSSDELSPVISSVPLSAHQVSFCIEAWDANTQQTRSDIAPFHIGDANGDVSSDEMTEAISAALDDLVSQLAQDIEGGMFSDILI